MLRPSQRLDAVPQVTEGGGGGDIAGVSRSLQRRCYCSEPAHCSHPAWTPATAAKRLCQPHAPLPPPQPPSSLPFFPRVLPGRTRACVIAALALLMRSFNLMMSFFAIAMVLWMRDWHQGGREGVEAEEGVEEGHGLLVGLVAGCSVSGRSRGHGWHMGGRDGGCSPAAPPLAVASG